ncbi:VOC family protein [Pedobacter sp. Hv1]|uniref:VOC family protein n=1 Tax=Pedobacter sp. Hv1 TaxID=1740090 RepID=UPI000AA2B562|nr:VOC family protein [Pedobacter sp. Hv1]
MMNIPKEHQTVMPYLMLADAKKFIDFVQLIFDATITAKQLTADGKIRHCEATIGGCTLMFTDANEDWAVATANLFVYVANADETYDKALENGASSVMGLSDQSYGRTCGIEDPCGNTWWITSL